MNRIFFLLILYFCITSIHAQNQLLGFELSDVRLTDSPFLRAEETDKKYMLSLNPDRLLAPFQVEAGLVPKAPPYGNWENTGLNGHIGGHYLSALALMSASTGDERVKARLNYMIDELEKCQLKNGNGYLSGIPGGREIWPQIKAGQIKSSGFSLNDKWVPLYNIHKTFAGLHDAYAIGGHQKAREMLIKLTDWFMDIFADLSEDQIQDVLRSEHGGLNEVFANLYQITSDKKYLMLARKFSDQSILRPLMAEKDVLSGLHANTQIPKVIGFEQIAVADKDTAWSNAAQFFWQTVVKNRTIGIGGNSVREHFNPSSDFSSMLESREGPETCNSYNMLKLTKQLFLASPSSKYLDYYERTLYNHILTSQRPDGGFVYFTPMRPGHYRAYSNPQESFWCCVGSGLENHGKYGELIYAHDEKDLYVNLFIPSKLSWKAKGLKLTQQTVFPNAEYSTFKIELLKSKKFAIRFRNPGWLDKRMMAISVNGKKLAASNLKNGYVSVDRTWVNGDLITVSLPMKNTVEFLPDESDWVVFLHGPIVLAAELDTLSQPSLNADGNRMGHIASGSLFPLNEAPLVFGQKLKLANELVPLKNSPLMFNFQNAVYQSKYKNLKLVPFYSLSEKRYIIYFPYSTLDSLPQRVRAIDLAEREKMKLENETVDIINTGEQQPESDHNFKGEKTETGIFQDRHYRNGTSWFSYTLKNYNFKGTRVRLLLYGQEKSSKFSVLINDVSIGKVDIDGTKGDIFYSQEIILPKNLLNANLEIRFEAEKSSTIANLYEVRLVK